MVAGHLECKKITSPELKKTGVVSTAKLLTNLKACPNQPVPRADTDVQLRKPQHRPVVFKLVEHIHQLVQFQTVQPNLDSFGLLLHLREHIELEVILDSK